MRVRELNREQLIQLKVRHLMNEHGDISYGEIAGADRYVKDSDIFEIYQGTEFVQDDFF